MIGATLGSIGGMIAAITSDSISGSIASMAGGMFGMACFIRSVARGISVISINEPLENNPSGKLLEGIIESIDEFYSANLGQDIKRGLRESAQRGFFVGSRPPDGLHKVDVKDGNKTRHKLEPDPADSKSVQNVKRIFAMAMNDNGTKEIAKALNKDGLRTSTGARWTKTYVHKILNNEAYCGTLVLGGRPGHEAIHSGPGQSRKRMAGDSR
jgi:hypothetical protein